MGISTYLQNKLVDHSLGGTTYTKPTATYLALFTSNPADDGSGTEVAEASYARVAIAWDASSGGIAKQNGACLFAVALTSWGTITHIGIFDALTSGNILYYGAMTTPRSIPADDRLNFADEAVTVQQASS